MDYLKMEEKKMKKRITAFLLIGILLFTSMYSGIASASTTSNPVAAWNIQVVDDGQNGATGYPGHFSSLALDTNGRPHISYTDDKDRVLKYAYWNGTQWLNQVVDNAYIKSPTSIALDAQNRPHISYSYNNSPANCMLRYATWNGTSWVKEDIDPIAAFEEVHNTIALDANGNPHIAYLSDANQHLRYAFKNSNGWNKIAMPTTLSQHAWYPSIALDRNSKAYISFYEYNKGLRLASYDGNWNVETIDSKGNYLSALIFDSSNQPHISYYDNTAKDLRYAYKNGTTWLNVLVDSSGDVGKFNSMALDRQGRPHIAYTKYNGSRTLRDELKYAYYNGSSWTIESVDNNVYGFGQNTAYVSMKLDGSDSPHISYLYYSSLDKLLYANKAAAQAPDIDVNPLSVDFGNVRLNHSLDRVITVRNTGNAPLIAGAITKTGNQFTILSDLVSGRSIPAGGSSTITVRFMSTAAGEALGSIVIPSNDPDESTVRVNLKGVSGVQDIKVEPVNINFGSLSVGSELSSVVTIRNIGSYELEFGRITMTGTGFRIVDGLSNRKLLPGESYAMQVYFRPTAAVSYSGSITIPSNDPDTSSVAVTLSGIGTAVQQPGISVSPTAVQFGSVLVGDTGKSTITVRNNGSTNLVIGSITKTGNSFTVTLDNASGKTLAPGASATVEISFTPNAAETFSGSLTIPSNDLARPQVHVSLNGMGAAQATSITATLKITPAALNVKAKGNGVINAMIELPAGYKASDIDLSSIRLSVGNASIQAQSFGKNANHKLTAAFNQSEIIRMIGGSQSATFILTGRLKNGIAFTGRDTIKIVGNPKK